jgi:SAM-dependent methyltransferase
MDRMLELALRRWWRRQAFDPSLVGIFVNPFFLTRRALARAMRRLASRVRGRVLDVGCGQKPYMEMFNVSAYIGVEIDTPENRLKNRQADHFYDGRHLPFKDGEFDTVVCNQVLEHVFEPEEFLAELSRVLRGGGALVLTVPFVWDEHEQPFDYARYSSFGLRHLLAKHGFEVSEQVKTLADASALCQLGNAYLYKVLRTRSLILNVLVTAVFMAPISLWGLVVGRLLPRNDDLYLDNVVVAHKSSAGS